MAIPVFLFKQYKSDIIYTVWLNMCDFMNNGGTFYIINHTTR